MPPASAGGHHLPQPRLKPAAQHGHAPVRRPHDVGQQRATAMTLGEGIPRKRRRARKAMGHAPSSATGRLKLRTNCAAEPACGLAGVFPRPRTVANPACPQLRSWGYMGAGRSRAEAVANMCTNDRRGLASARPGFAEVPWLRLRRRQSFLEPTAGTIHARTARVRAPATGAARSAEPAGSAAAGPGGDRICERPASSAAPASQGRPMFCDPLSTCRLPSAGHGRLTCA
jgi:hypothetical protein